MNKQDCVNIFLSLTNISDDCGLKEAAKIINNLDIILDYMYKYGVHEMYRYSQKRKDISPIDLAYQISKAASEILSWAANDIASCQFREHFKLIISNSGIKVATAYGHDTLLPAAVYSVLANMILLKFINLKRLSKCKACGKHYIYLHERTYSSTMCVCKSLTAS